MKERKQKLTNDGYVVVTGVFGVFLAVEVEYLVDLL